MLSIRNALLQAASTAQLLDVAVDPINHTVTLNKQAIKLNTLRLGVPIHGTVYGTLLNFSGALAALGDDVNQPPYRAPPKAPVLYIKPINTYSAYGAAITVPPGVEKLEMGATLGLVIGQTACRLKPQQALDVVAGYTIVNDISIPHSSYFRPALSSKCRDGFCPIGPWVIAARHIPNPDALGLQVYIDGQLQQENTTANLIRSVRQLLAEVTDFMTLYPGDVVLVGVAENPPLASAGQRVLINIEGVGCLENSLVAATEAVL